MQIESVTSMQLNSPLASSPLLSLCGFPRSSSLSSNISSTPYTHISRLPWLLANRRKSLFTITPRSSFYSINISISAMSRVGYKWGARRLLIFPRPIPPPHLHFLRALATSLSLLSHESSTSCWSLT